MLILNLDTISLVDRFGNKPCIRPIINTIMMLSHRQSKCLFFFAVNDIIADLKIKIVYNSIHWILHKCVMKNQYKKNTSMKRLTGRYEYFGLLN